jgi:DNA-binding transcriptional MerR regulator
MAAATPFLTIGDVGRHFGLPAWMIRRVFERGLLPPARRVGAYRVVEPKDLPRIKRALERAGYLAAEVAL